MSHFATHCNTQPMNYTDLKQLFQVAGKSARDFIRWAESHGIKVHDATVSRHLAGTQGITGPWALAYKYYFSDIA